MSKSNHNDENGVENNDETQLAMSTPTGVKLTKQVRSRTRIEDGLKSMRQLIHAIENHHHKHAIKRNLLIYIAIIVVYIGIQFGLIAANFVDQDQIEALYYAPFHYLEFWAVFVFTTMEAYTLVSVDVVDLRSVVQSGILMFNIIVTLLVAILFSLWDGYEVPAHYVEYSVQIFISIVDVFFVFQILRKRRRDREHAKMPQQLRLYEDPCGEHAHTDDVEHEHASIDWSGFVQSAQGVLAMLAVLLSMLQLFIYSELIPSSIGGERAAHFCEFINEGINGSFALWYAVLLFKNAQRELAADEKRIFALV